MGTDPAYVDTHSLFEILSTFEALKKRRAKTADPASPEEMQEIRDGLLEMTKNDPSVRLH